MKLKLHFQLSGKRQLLPLNYQYPISSWIYKVMSAADAEFTNMLHEKGYQLENGKNFKLFCFSKLRFPNKTWRIIPKSDRMEIWARNAFLEIGFQLPEQTEKFVIGLFKNQELTLGDKISQVNMQVGQVESLAGSPITSSPTRLTTLSPLVLGLDTDEAVHEYYATPLHKDYAEVFIKNLIEKHQAAGKEKISMEDVKFKVLQLHKNKKGEPKTELQSIKAHTTEETKVKGWYFYFELTAPAELIETGLNSGFGSMSSLGFGWCEVIEKQIELKN
jgi:CRISPR-associated endoribonuclease Cas6